MCAALTIAEADDSPPVPAPDGGYGWVIVAAAFIVNLIADGLTFSFGIILTELFQDLDNSREEISWIGSLLAGVPLLLGPVTSVLIDRYGCRNVTMLGSLLSGLGFCLMFVLPADSLLLFIVSAGMLAGLGLGLCYMPAVVVVAYYFLERRSLATGISVSGSGVGTILFAYIVRRCIELYTWRGAFLLLGGLLLNMGVCGALFRPMQLQQQHQMLSRRSRQKSSGFRSLLSIPTFVQLQQQQQQQQQRTRQETISDAAAVAATAAAVTAARSRRQETATAFSLRRQLQLLASKQHASAVQSDLWVSCPDFCHEATAKQQEQQQQQQQPKVLSDIRFLFTNWNYLGFLASNFLLYFWYDIAYTFMPDHAKDIGISTQQVSLIVAVIGVSNTIGQIAIGYVSDNPSINSVLLYVVCMGLAGITNCAVPLCQTVPSLLAYAMCFGFLVSANYSLCSIVLIELFGLNRFNTGYGFMLFFQGLANLMGPPVMGHMRDQDSSYNQAFIASGIFVTASNFLIVPAYAAAAAAVRAAVSSRQQQKQQKKQNQQLELPFK